MLGSGSKPIRWNRARQSRLPSPAGLLAARTKTLPIGSRRERQMDASGLCDGLEGRGSPSYRTALGLAIENLLVHQESGPAAKPS